ncbi:MAG TPA: hypothetical protein VLF91_04070 [Candidatus Saccharimonadales bacterium]|nr:hypothetical protein [Candidatus Saccharimonadales bacterium]
MIKTVLVPAWSGSEELKGIAATRNHLGVEQGLVSAYLRSYRVQFDEFEGCDVIVLDGRAETMPRQLQDMPMWAIKLVDEESPLTMADDGHYSNGDITARVQRYKKGGAPLQRIVVTGGQDTDLEELNEWFDDLVSGRCNGSCDGAIIYPSQDEPAAKTDAESDAAESDK